MLFFAMTRPRPPTTEQALTMHLNDKLLSLTAGGDVPPPWGTGEVSGGHQRFDTTEIMKHVTSTASRLLAALTETASRFLALLPLPRRMLLAGGAREGRLELG